MDLGNRISQTLTDKGISQSELAERIGISQVAVSNIILGKVQKPRNLLDIANALGVDPNWLQSGVGEPTVNNSGNIGGVYQSNLTNSPVTTTTNRSVNHYGVSAAKSVSTDTEDEESIVLTAYHRLAGGDGYLNEDYPDEIRSIEFSPDKFTELFGRRSAKNLALFVVDGNSMFDPAEPETSLKDGDYVCVDLSVKEFSSDGIYAFTFEGYEKIKRLQHLSGNRIKIISDNPRYEDEVIEGDKLKELHIRGKFFKKLVLGLVDL